MSVTYDYIVFDFHEGATMGAVELQEKLDEVGDSGFSLVETLLINPNSPMSRSYRFIMRRSNAS